MPRGNQDKTREFQEKMRTQGAAGFAAGPWRDIEESLGMDQSVVVDQEGNPVWSVKHTRKPRQRVSRSTFDRLLGAVAVLAIATLVTSVLAIYLEQTGDPASARLASTDSAAGDDAAASAIALPQPPTSGFIKRPAVEVVASPASGLSRTPASPEPEQQTAAVAASDALPTPAAEPVVQMAATTATGTQAASPAPDTAAIAVTTEPALSGIPEETTDPVEAIAAITREASPAAIAEAQPARGADPAPAAPTTGADTQTIAADAAAAIAAEPADEAPESDALAQAPVTDITTEPAGSMPASDESASASGAINDADNMNADSTGPGTLAQVTNTTTESADSMPVGNEPAGASTTTDGEDNISAPSAEPAGSIAEQTRPAAEVEELARLEPAGIAAPEPASSAPLADVIRPGSTGRWVINLASYAGPKTASRMQRKFEDLGVSTEKQVAEVNGKTMYRLRIASFESRADAEAYFETIKGALGLESAWITRK
jgi:hypothetical protein